MATVTDPAGGAYAVEKLTDDLVLSGWEEFQRIEESGGAWYALEDRSFVDRVSRTWERRQRDIAHRRRPLTGLSEFPNLGETLPERPRQTSDFDNVRRWGEDFEAMRDEPAATAVFLATMGPVAAHTARATFATNLLAAGGVAVTPAGPTQDADGVLATYAGQPVVCLAGPDAAYADWGTDLVARLRDAGARHVILAGRPRDLPVDDSCAVGVDALAFLRRTREALS